MNLSNIAVEMRVKNYPSMCRLLDEPILQGNSKVSQMKEWARFIEWERDGHAFVIVGVREAPTPKPLRPDDKYGDSILTCLKWDYARRAHKEGETVGYSFQQLLFVCGFVGDAWSGYAGKLNKELDRIGKSGLLPVGKRRAMYFLYELDGHVNQYCAMVLDRVLGRLDRGGYLKFRKSTWVKRGNLSMRATPEEEAAIERIEADVKEELGIGRLNLYNRGGYYRKFDKRIKDELGIDSSLRLREIAFDDFPDEVGGWEYDEARSEVNKNSLDEFMRLTEADARKGVEKAYRLMAESTDENVIEAMELFEYLPEDVYRNFYGDIHEEVEFRKTLVSWFVEIGGREKHELAVRHLEEFGNPDSENPECSQSDIL